jgi:predicted nucleotidyltransferase component of viral defense system
MKKEKKNLPASIHQKLLNIARKENRPMNELLQYYAIERFLFRLGSSKYRPHFILKGGQMLKVWNAPLARPTIDIDLLGKVNNSIKNLENIVKEFCLIELDDGIIFDLSSIKGETIRKNAEYQGVRINLKCFLGKIRLHLQIDFGFGDTVFPYPIEIELPELLDLGKPSLFGYTPESLIAEKFHAMVNLDMTNTRMKDFYDIWLISKNLKIDSQILEQAIIQTFKTRETTIPLTTPIALKSFFFNNPEKQAQWQAFLRKNRIDLKIKLEEVAKEIESFLTSVFKK